MPPRRLLFAILILALAGGGVAAWRKYRKAEREATKPAKTEKALQELARSTAETRAVETLVRELRAITQWRAAQPAATPATIAAEVVRRLAVVPQDELPPECAAPFQEFQAAWSTLAAGQPPQTTATRGQAASAALQQFLAARGFTDLRL